MNKLILFTKLKVDQSQIKEHINLKNKLLGHERENYRLRRLAPNH